ncbi:MAG: metal-dependent transcriptional regulator [Nanoarchaeota archaeon]|nr:metal-dependent transcriptional regulator [Nanoarchaeota archaeon]
MDNLTKSIEDYLEAIYLIAKEKKVVRVKQIAEFLNISLPSVSEAVQKLRRAGFVKSEKYEYINLTKEGRVLAKSIYAKHKLLLFFLSDMLKVDKKTALKDACAIEHCLSKESAQKLKKFVALKLNKK